MKTDLRKSLSTLEAAEIVAAINTASRYPSKGTGGTLVPVDSWDGRGEVPTGWTAAVVAEDRGDGTSVIEVSAQDSKRLDSCDSQECVDARTKLAAAGDVALTATATAVDAPVEAP